MSPCVDEDDGGLDGVRLFKRDYKGEFLAYERDELGKSPATLHTYGWSLTTLERFTGKPIHKVTSGDLRNFKRESSFAPSTVQGVVVAMHQFHKWGALEGFWSRNGIMDVPTPRVRQEPKAPMSVESARKMLEACTTPLDYRIVYLQLYAGLRIREATLIRAEHWRPDRLVFGEGVAKGGKKRSVPLHPELKRVRHLILSKSPKSTGVLQSNVNRLRERTGVRDLEGRVVTSHTLRRTFATTLYEQHEVPYEVVAKVLGHGMDVTARYVRVPWERMVGAIEGLDYYPGEPVQLSFVL